MKRRVVALLFAFILIISVASLLASCGFIAPTSSPSKARPEKSDIAQSDAASADAPKNADSVTPSRDITVNASASQKTDLHREGTSEPTDSHETHEYIYYGRINATCTLSGCRERYICGICGALFDADKNEATDGDLFIPATGHDYGEWNEAVDATCSSTGSLGHYACSLCGKKFDSSYDELSSIIIPTTVHNYENDVCSVCGHVDTSATNGLILEFDESLNEYAVIGLDLDSEITDIVIPAQINGFPVRTIAPNAFSGYQDITSVTLSDSVERISESAFSDCGLSSLTLGKSVVFIDSEAFSGCHGLTSVYYNGTLEQWLDVTSESPFYARHDLYIDSEKLTELVIPSSVKEIKKNLFFSCNLEEITLHESIISIDNDAFRSCPIKKLTAPARLLYIFDKSLLEEVDITSGDSISDFTFDGCSELTDVTLPEGLKTIGYKAFSSCPNLTDITLPESLIQIGAYAFEHCGFTEITVPNEVVTEAPNQAFRGCPIKNATVPAAAILLLQCTYGSPLEEVTVTSGGEIPSCAFYVYSDEHAFPCLKSVTICDGVTAIGEMSFAFCSELTSVSIPSSVTQIGFAAFSFCEKLTSVLLPEDITAIDASTFVACVGLTEMTIPESVTEIGDGAFESCVSLTDIAIPASVTEIGEFAFADCTELSEVNYGGTLEDWCGIRFSDKYSNPIHLSATLLIGGQPVTEVVIPSGISEIGQYAFSGCSTLTSLTVPSTVTAIGDGAFDNCVMLEEINFDAYECSRLNAAAFNLSGTETEGGITVSVGNNVKCIPAYFFGPSEMKITSVVFEDNSICESIGEGAFYGCHGLTSVVLPDSITHIDSWAFADCDGLETINLPAGITRIGEYAFRSCTSLTELTLPASITAIENSVFYGCTSLTQITVCSELESIGHYAFYNCEGLTDIFYAYSVDDWKALQKSLFVFGGIPSEAQVSVHCSDGNTALR